MMPVGFLLFPLFRGGRWGGGLSECLLVMYYLWLQKTWARVLRAYSSSKRERRAATWLRPGPPRPSRQSEEEEGDSEPLLLLEAGDISCRTYQRKGEMDYFNICDASQRRSIVTFRDNRRKMYLNVAQTFLQVGNHLGELRPVLWWKLLVIIPAWMNECSLSPCPCSS